MALLPFLWDISAGKDMVWVDASGHLADRRDYAVHTPHHAVPR